MQPDENSSPYFEQARSVTPPTLTNEQLMIRNLQGQIAQQSVLYQQLKEAIENPDPGRQFFSRDRTHEPKLPLPERFNGNRKLYRTFSQQVKTILVLNASRFPTDESKILFIGSLLTGDAAHWFEATTRHDSQITFQTFNDLFSQLFSDPHTVTTARREIRSLAQGTMSASVFCTKFLALSADTGFNEPALIDLFRSNLSPAIKDVLATSADCPSTINEFIKYVITIDNRLFERKLESRLGPRSFSPMPFQRHRGPAQIPVPMELDAIASATVNKPSRGPLSQDEKDRRRRGGLCLYCGKAGHLALQCPAKNRPARVI
jgi:Ty3 transposon capsid-like protein